LTIELIPRRKRSCSLLLDSFHAYFRLCASRGTIPAYALYLKTLN
jgi:hypothetical protein